ncbi:hypothetical protein ACKKBF_B04410 [Auxenochlorella protothecoides x Auxenochlorella symbiontica]
MSLAAALRAVWCPGQYRKAHRWAAYIPFRQLQTVQPEQEEPGTDKRYIDRLVVTAQAGRGGSGSSSCIQKSNRGRKITADGGNGGSGGDVIVRASGRMKSLAGVAQLHKAEPGSHGSSRVQHGGAGDNATILVPLGTLVSRILEPSAMDGAGEEAQQPAQGQAGVLRRPAPRQPADLGQEEAAPPPEEAELPPWLARWRTAYTGDAVDADRRDGFDDEVGGGAGGQPGAGPSAGAEKRRGPRHYPTEVLADLVEEGQEVVVARGGRGGMGNAAMRSLPNRPAPRESTPGAAGERHRLLLEMKILADIGLVGVPNAGKSSLLRALTAARPKVGSYAFTTLMPQLGVVDLGWGERMVIADVPGLIAGAAENRGLGHAFLKHVERTRALAYVLDASAGLHGSQGLRPWRQLELLREEIAAYSPALAALPSIVIANKVDLLPRPSLVLCALRERTHLPVLASSARDGTGVPELLRALRALWAGEEVDGTPPPCPT